MKKISLNIRLIFIF